MASSANPRSTLTRSGYSIPDETVTTTIFISNLHCPSCIDSIQESLSLLQPPPDFVSHSIVSHSVVLRHSRSLPVNVISDSLEVAGFEIHSIFQESPTFGRPIEVFSCEQPGGSEWENSFEKAVDKWQLSRPKPHHEDIDMLRIEKHVEQCEQCRAEAGGVSLDSKGSDGILLQVDETKSQLEKDVSFESDTIEPTSPAAEDFVKVDPTASTVLYKAVLAISGMTCSSCVSSITHAVQQLIWVRSIDVNLLTNSATVVFDGKHSVDEVVSTIEDAGFDVSVDSVGESPRPAAGGPDPKENKWRATYAIGGMTCSSCVAAITNALKEHSWIEKADVNLVSNSATIIFEGKDHLPTIKELIEDIGYDATLDNVLPDGSPKEDALERTVQILVTGMYCPHCPGRVLQALREKYDETLQIMASPLTEKRPVLTVKYIPQPPELTVRGISATISDVDTSFKPSVFHPPTIEERAQEMHARERRRILTRLLLAVICAIPAFILGVVYMSLLPETNHSRDWLMMPTWAGNVSRIEWALFICATPVYFLAADTFHIRALKEIRALWRPGSRTPILHRFYRFGSMNMLMSLGTSIAYFASIADLIRKALKQTSSSMTDSYFDSVVFLTMFLLIGRFIEAYSKARTGDAVTSLGNLRPVEAILVDNTSGDQKIATDLLDIGDTVRVLHGASPPFDGTVLEGSTDFDESSLTGESRPVNKSPGDSVFSGTINKGPPIKIKITTVSGTSMLDQIIKVVREGQTRRAPVERAADTITSHFVPFVTLVAITTWVVWLALGASGIIPNDWKGSDAGGWAPWSLRFAIAVFVVACPCGIGLAAPTALFVGGGLAAKHGILVKGGGEAFQEASSLDCIVFDKTGTLTEGGDPAVTDYEVMEGQEQGMIFGTVKKLEESSSHPVARALVSFCGQKEHQQPEVLDIDEVPGKGLKGMFKLTSKNDGSTVQAIIGNEAFMADYNVSIPTDVSKTLETWKSQGKSVALAATSTETPAAADPSRRNSITSVSPAIWTLAAIFSISDPLRPSAAPTIAALQARGLEVWMLSGDNPTTARAVGAQIGIPSSNIIAGVLPEQKAEKIRYLQRSLPKKNSKNHRATIAMLGDGINDSPALSAADVSIAIGSGSDVAVSSASFILVKSDLEDILTLLDLSRTVFRRVWFNFGWALVYNLVAMPVAAGVLFPVRTGGGGHVRLDPVWASLAMAMSSISVVCSSLMLRSRVPGVGFRAKRQR